MAGRAHVCRRGRDWMTKKPIRHRLYRVLLSEYRLVIGCGSEGTNQTQGVQNRILPSYAGCYQDGKQNEEAQQRRTQQGRRGTNVGGTKRKLTI